MLMASVLYMVELSFKVPKHEFAASSLLKRVPLVAIYMQGVVGCCLWSFCN